MRRLLFLLTLTLIVACDGGQSSSNTIYRSSSSGTAGNNNNLSTSSQPRAEPSLDELELMPPTAQFGRDFDARLGTPQPIFDDQASQNDENAENHDQTAVPDPSPTSRLLLGTAFPTRSAYPTSTPYPLR